MTITEAERERVIAEHRREEREKLRARMSRMGKSRSAKKRSASRRNMKVALATRWNKIIDGVRPKKRKP